MAIETNIILEFKGFPVIIPETVVVPLHSKVRYIIRLYPEFKRLRFQWNLRRVELYFQDRPNGFEKRYNANIPDRFDDVRNRDNAEVPTDIVLAEGNAESSGEFKYGVKASNSQEEELFDEDPYLIILPQYRYGILH